MAVDVSVLEAAVLEQDDVPVAAVQPVAVAVPEQHALDAALVQACRKGFAPVAALLLAAGARPDAHVDGEEGAGGAAALALAAAADSGDAVRLLIRVGGGVRVGGGAGGLPPASRVSRYYLQLLWPVFCSEVHHYYFRQLYAPPTLLHFILVLFFPFFHRPLPSLQTGAH